VADKPAADDKLHSPTRTIRAIAARIRSLNIRFAKLALAEIVRVGFRDSVYLSDRRSHSLA
jgi:hypothetical protein